MKMMMMSVLCTKLTEATETRTAEAVSDTLPGEHDSSTSHMTQSLTDGRQPAAAAAADDEDEDEVVNILGMFSLPTLLNHQLIDLRVTWVCVHDLTRHQNDLKVD